MKMRAAMLKGPELETTMVIREVENGWVIDVDLEGEMRSDQPTYMPRFAKFVTTTGDQLLSQVSGLLTRFDTRKPCLSQRILGNLRPQDADKRVMTITQLKGGYVVEMAEPVLVKLDPELVRAGLPPDAAERKLPADAVPPRYEYTKVEVEARVLFFPEDVRNAVGLFFGLKEE